MRLIDADALKRKVLEWMPPDPCGREGKEYPFETDIVVSLMMEIEEAPTIDIDRPQGEWVVYPLMDEGRVELECPICGDTFIRAVDYKPHFCENCGARMRGDE